jgi:Family of unknown function (DUF6252)
MKLPRLLCYAFCLITFFTFSQCKKNKDKTPLEQLPPETQTGANTFACLVDGQVFIPKGDPFGGPIKKASYQYVDGGYYLLLSGSRDGDEDGSSVGIFADSLQLSVGAFDLTSNDIRGKLYGRYIYTKIGTLGKYYNTNQIYRGKLFIKKFDEINQIISGTFWFDAIDSTANKVVKITDGRFDMQYVR